LQGPENLPLEKPPGQVFKDPQWLKAFREPQVEIKETKERKASERKSLPKAGKIVMKDFLRTRKDTKAAPEYSRWKETERKNG
jgi:hypothetical protein